MRRGGKRTPFRRTASNALQRQNNCEFHSHDLPIDGQMIPNIRYNPNNLLEESPNQQPKRRTLVLTGNQSIVATSVAP